LPSSRIWREDQDESDQHMMRRDSKSIPGVIMADIRMRMRVKLRNDVEEGAED
jgi:hypothetical protein